MRRAIGRWMLAWLVWSVGGMCRGTEMEFVTVGDVGNVPFEDFYNAQYVYSNGVVVDVIYPEVGGVDYVFRLGKYEVTAAQYLEFLNAVDPQGSNTLGLFHPSTPPMYGDPSFDGCDYILDVSQPEGQRYFLRDAERADLPAWGMKWYGAARFCNWLHNGKGGPGSTEGDATTGAYDTRFFDDGIATNDPPTHNPGAKFWIPTFDEWFKAAYYKGGSTNAGYWTNPCQYDGEPHGVMPTDAPNTCNLYDRRSPRPPCPEARVAVGSYPNSLSPYGCLDMAGNGNEWSEKVETNYIGGVARRTMGGAWWWLTDHPVLKAQLTFSTHSHPPTDWWDGLRVAALSSTNAPPTCSITSPGYGDVFTSPTSLTVQASASDMDGTIRKVEFFQGVEKLGEVTNPPFECVWADIGPGRYSLLARATDNAGDVGTSPMVAVTVNSAQPGWLTLLARDQDGAEPAGAGVQIYLNGAWILFPSGSQTQLTAGVTYRVRGHMPNVAGPEINFLVEAWMTELVVPFWTATIRARDQHGADVTNATVALNNVVGSPFAPGTAVTLPKGYQATGYGKVPNVTGPAVSFTFVYPVMEVDPRFWTATIRARDQHGADVTNAIVYVNGVAGSPFAPGTALTLPRGYNARFQGKVPNLAGPYVYFVFTTGLTDPDPGFWTLSARCRDQTGAVVGDGLAHLRYVGAEYYADGASATVAYGSTVSTRSRRASLYADAYQSVVFTNGVETFAAKFRRVSFRALATNSPALVPGAQIEIYGSGLAQFENGSAQALPHPDTLRVKVWDGATLMLDRSGIAVSDSTETVDLVTSWVDPNPADTDGDGIPDDWEETYFGGPTSADAQGDPDGDGMTNLEEYVAGTDPTNRDSKLEIGNLLMQTGAVVRFGTVSGRWYGVQYKDNLATTNVWGTLGAEVQGDGTVKEVPDAGMSGRRFYRVRVRLP